MAKAKNPFIYGGRVDGETSCNRRKEIKELLSDIMARQHVIFYLPRSTFDLTLKVLRIGYLWMKGQEFSFYAQATFA